jgi:hypothetical protein
LTIGPRESPTGTDRAIGSQEISPIHHSPRKS